MEKVNKNQKGTQRGHKSNPPRGNPVPWKNTF